jgi:hypothetical protein
MNIFDMSEQEFDEFVRNPSGDPANAGPTEKKLVDILSAAISADTPKAKAMFYVELANMAMAMADKTLGAQGIVATSVQLNKH